MLWVFLLSIMLSMRSIRSLYIPRGVKFRTKWTTMSRNSLSTGSEGWREVVVHHPDTKLPIDALLARRKHVIAVEDDAYPSLTDATVSTHRCGLQMDVCVVEERWLGTHPLSAQETVHAWCDQLDTRARFLLNQDVADSSGFQVRSVSSVSPNPYPNPNPTPNPQS